MLNKKKMLSCMVCMFITSAILHAQDSGWTINPHDYQYDMTLYVQIVSDGTPVTDLERYEVAAFVGDDCRGVSQVQSQNGFAWFYLRVYSNKATDETLTYKVYDKTNNRFLNVEEKCNFESNGLLGMPSTPTTLTLKRYTLGDVNDDGKINIADITGILAIMAGNSNVEMIKEAADVNGDSKINISDITAVLSIMAGK